MHNIYSSMLVKKSLKTFQETKSEMFWFAIWHGQLNIYVLLAYLHIRIWLESYFSRFRNTKTNALFHSIPTPRTQNLPHKLSKFWTYCDKYKIMAGQATHNLESIKASAQFHAVGKIGFPQIPKSHFPSQQASVVSLVPVIMASRSGTPVWRVTNIDYLSGNLTGKSMEEKWQKSKDYWVSMIISQCNLRSELSRFPSHLDEKVDEERCVLFSRSSWPVELLREKLYLS